MGVITFFAFGLAVLANFVIHIVGVSSQKQMGRIDAKWVVAFVQNSHFFGNRANRKMKRQSMCPPSLVLIRRGRVTAVS